MILGQEPPGRGAIQVGETVHLSYVDQQRDDLRADRTVFDEIASGIEFIKVGNREIPARAYVSGFNFRDGSAEALRQALSRRADRAAPRQAAEVGRQRPPARRAHDDLDVNTLHASRPD